MSLKEKAMSVNLTISQWTARKFDAKASKEIETTHNATNAGRFNKILVAQEALKEITKLSSAARNYHYYNTLPWSDNGDRLLPAKNFLNYMKEISEYREKYNLLVNKFINDYPQYIEEAKSRLKTLFNQYDYPPVETISKKFDMTIVVMPIPDQEDFRIDISKEESELIKSGIVKELNSRVENAVASLISRIEDSVLKMYEALVQPEKIFRDSLVGNIAELADIAPLLNFNNDNKIDTLVQMIRPLYENINPNMLRDNKEFRKEMADKAQRIYQNMKLI